MAGVSWDTGPPVAASSFIITLSLAYYIAKLISWHPCGVSTALTGTHRRQAGQGAGWEKRDTTPAGRLAGRSAGRVIESGICETNCWGFLPNPSLHPLPFVAPSTNWLNKWTILWINLMFWLIRFSLLKDTSVCLSATQPQKKLCIMEHSTVNGLVLNKKEQERNWLRNSADVTCAGQRLQTKDYHTAEWLISTQTPSISRGECSLDGSDDSHCLMSKLFGTNWAL